jgi:hypothetical protein
VLEISFNWVVAILRIFDIAKADEFYRGFPASRSIATTASIPVLHSIAKFRAAICSCI